MYLCSGGDGLRVWDSGNRYNLLCQYSPHDQFISSLDWNVEHSTVLSTCSSGDKAVVSAALSGGTLFEFGHDKKYICGALNTGSRYAVCGSDSGAVAVWDLKKRAQKRSYQGHSSAITSLTFNQTYTHLVSGSEQGKIMLHNILSANPTTLSDSSKTQAIRQLQFSHWSKNLLGAAGTNGSVYLFDITTGSEAHVFRDAHHAPCTGLVFSPINEMLMLSVGLDMELHFYDTKAKKVISSKTLDEPLISLAAYSDGVTIAIGTSRGKIYIYDLRQTGSSLQTLVGHRSSVRCLKYQHRPPGTCSRKPNAAEEKYHHRTGSTSISDNTVENSASSISSSPQAGFDVFSPVLATDTTETENRPQTVGRNSLSLHRLSSDGVFSPLTDSTFNTFNHTRGNTSQSVASNSHMSLHEKSSDATSASRPSVAPVDQPSTTQPVSQSTQLPTTQRAEHKSSLTYLPPDSRDKPSISVLLNGETRTSPRKASRTTDSSSSITETPASSRKTSDSSKELSSLRLRRRLEQKPDSKSAATTPTTPAVVSATNDASSGDSARAPLSPSVIQYQQDFLRSTLEDVVEDLREEQRQMIQGLHVDMFRQFAEIRLEFKAMLEKYSVNRDLIAEIERLRAENQRLKKRF